MMKDLPFPILLGRDWPGFDRLLAAANPLGGLGGGSFAKEQCVDDRLKHCWTQTASLRTRKFSLAPILSHISLSRMAYSVVSLNEEGRRNHY